MLESSAYGNIEVYCPDGKLMFIANEKKMNFYIKNGLVENIGDKKYKLLFEPKGLGYADRNQYMLIRRENKCVACGNEDLEDLTRHHVVPSRFRRHLPLHIKSNDFRYVVFLCNDCHNYYGYHEDDENDALAAELGTKTLKEYDKLIILEKRKIGGIAYAILYNQDRIPEERIEELKVSFKEKSGMEPTEENLNKTFKRRYEPNSPENDFGAIIVSKISNIYDFQIRWLKHFVEIMEPGFLPEDLQILLD